MNTEPFTHHTFAPIRADGDRRIVAAETEWARVQMLHWRSLRDGQKRRVEIVGDLFEPWTGGVCNRRGEIMECGETHGLTPWVGIGPYSRPIALADVRRRVFRLIDDCPHITFLLNTTRLEEARKALRAYRVKDRDENPELVENLTNAPRPNLIIGTTVSTQREVDDRLPLLLRLPAAVRWVRCVPGEALDFSRWLPKERWFNAVCEKCGYVGSTEFFLERRYHDDADVVCPKCEKIILANEVGRIGWITIAGSLDSPTNLDHVRGIIAQGKAAGVPVWVERLGHHFYDFAYKGSGKKHRGATDEAVDELGRILDSVTELELHAPNCDDPSEWPEDVRVRETP